MVIVSDSKPVNLSRFSQTWFSKIGRVRVIIFEIPFGKNHFEIIFAKSLNFLVKSNLCLVKLFVCHVNSSQRLSFNLVFW